MNDDNAWHLDKKVPLGILAAIFIQTVSLVYIGTSVLDNINHRLQTLEASDAIATPQINANRIQNTADRVLSLETQYTFIKETLTRIETKLIDKDRKQP